MKNAYALSSLKIGKTTYKASTDDEPVVVKMDDKEFKRLEAMNAVREATAKEVKAAEVEDVEFIEESAAEEPTDGKSAKGGKSKTTSNTKKAGDDTDLSI